MDTRPVGIFDSGVGGLTVVDKFYRLLPGEKIIYLGDTARVPYGNKSKETVTRFSKEIVDFLLKFRVKLIIAACNTASSLALGALRKSSPVPVVGVIEPGVREALRRSKTKRIGVIGTEATISSSAYKKELKSLDKRIFVVQKSCPLFVPLVENMWLEGSITFNIVKKYLSDILDKKIDSLILGCTHYPLLKNVIRKVAGKNIALIDSSMAVAEHTKQLLENKSLLNGAANGNAQFFVTDDTKTFTRLAKSFLKKSIKAKKAIL